MASASRSSTQKSTTGSYDHYWPLTGHLHHPSYATHCPPSTGTSTLTPTTPASERQPENSTHIHEFVTPSCGYGRDAPEGTYAVLHGQFGSRAFGFEHVRPSAFQGAGRRIGDALVRDELGEHVEPLEGEPSDLGGPGVVGAHSLLGEPDVFEGDLLRFHLTPFVRVCEEVERVRHWGLYVDALPVGHNARLLS